MTRNLVLSGGPQHDFDATTAVLVELGREVGLTATVVTEPPEFFAELGRAGRGEIPPWDLVTVNALRWRMDADRYAHLRDRFAFSLGPADAAALVHHVGGGGGLVVMHTGVICFDAEPTWHELAGASWNWEHSSHPPLADFEVTVTEAGRRHPLTIGVEPFCIRDELYGTLDVVDDLVPLLTGECDGREHPLLWAREFGDGRVVTDVLGHGTASLAHPAHGAVIGRAFSWARRGGSEP